MIPAAAFNVSNDGADFLNEGFRVGLNSGGGSFSAPVYLPHGARIRMIKLFAGDFNTSNNFCIALFETQPKTGGTKRVGQFLCTVGSSGNQQPMKYYSHYVKWYYGYYILLSIPAGTNLSAFAVMIKYNVRQ
jgi:hypothetical protein